MAKSDTKPGETEVGMNFENMPELHAGWGYVTLLAVMGWRQRR